jgi:protein-tyrosine phosphatase
MRISRVAIRYSKASLEYAIEKKVSNHIKNDFKNILSAISNSDELKELISTIKNNLILSNPVLIHCNGGKGRSGMIAALVLKAMKEKDTVKKVRENVVGAIETEEQETFVENWI